MALGHNRRDVHFDARMFTPYIVANKWKAYLALTSNEDGYIVEPLLATPEGELRNPYNFGGPTGSTDSLNSREHTESVAEWAVKHGFSSKYCTLIPFLAKEQLKLLSSSNISPEYRKESVIIDLNDQKIRGTTRRMANKAQSLGATVKTYSLDNLKYFIDMYAATMDRVHAQEHWNFSPKWFEVFARFLNPCLMMTEFEGKLESGCLILYSHQYPVAYYHFQGSFNRFPTVGINHMLVLAACEFVKSIGIRYLYLGGGVTDKEDDGLFVFKKGFSSDKLPVFSYNITYNKVVN
jgi:lipid II:glycine glycyltransferase (peptidoglycan interpeptide bridge formation enzyme)